MAGKRLRFVVQLDSPATDLDGYHCFSCQSADPADAKGIRFYSAEQIGGNEVTVLVEAELRVRQFDAWYGVPAFLCYELFDAVRASP
jgi:hypothetical protein